ncbi:orotate phosphoribosyltransferase [Candidatus Micrarchaeota archaeon]|nr:orotate phosphoribosyltransferase [Candidatus Micrarchaeota archaeon]
MNESQEELAEFLVKHKALQFGEFTLKSGRKSPYYYNIRSLSTGEAISKIASVYAQKIMDENLEPDVLFGPAYAGIPLAVATALYLNDHHDQNVRFAFDRKEVKEYGDANTKALIGSLQEGDRVLIIDDMMTTGGTKLEAKQKIEAFASVDVIGILISFDRMEKDENGVYAAKSLKDQGLPVYSVLDAPSVFEFLRNRNIGGAVHVTDAHFQAFQAYRKQYGV